MERDGPKEALFPLQAVSQAETDPSEAGREDPAGRLEGLQSLSYCNLTCAAPGSHRLQASAHTSPSMGSPHLEGRGIHPGHRQEWPRL